MVLKSYLMLMGEKEENLALYILSFQKGDFSSFTSFFEEVKRPLFYNIYALTKNNEEAEDLLQETFVRFLKNINEVSTSKSVLGYLFTLSRNLAIDHLRKKNRNQNVDYDLSLYGERDNYSIDDSSLLNKIKGILKDKEFEIFVLHAMNDLSFKEIARIQKRPIGTVLWAYSNAIKKIRKEIPYESL